jgi:hypothetical protein
MRANLLHVAIAVSNFAVPAVLAQQPTCQSVLLITALNQKTSEPVDGLTADDLLAKLKGHDLPIHSLSPAPINRRIVFVLDRSGSMTPTDHTWGQPYDPNQLVKQALSDALSEIPSGDKVAFRAFTGPSSTQTDFMNPTAARAKATEMLAWEPNARKEGRRTPLWDNIDAALRMLNPHQPGDVLVVVTDGQDNISKLQRGHVQEELLEIRVPVLAMLATNPYAPTPEDREGPNDFLDLAHETGGAVAPLGTGWRSNDSRIGSPLSPSQLVSQLAHQYKLDLVIPSIQRFEKWNLRLKSKENEENLKLFYPRYFSPCAATQ